MPSKYHARRKFWKLANKEKLQEQGIAYQEANKEKISAQKKEYYLKNRDRILARNKAYNAVNRSAVSMVEAEWRSNNKGKVAAYIRKYQASKIQRTPKWLTSIDFERITNEYRLAEILRKVTNQDWHVDHIVPLQGKNVSGLHVPSNLRVVLASENIKKGNRFEVSHA
jgi:5-methylcytosine-specific restriction endonuclease McrA